MTSQTPAELEMQFKGSFAYMAPEALRQETLSRKADIWSLGCLALELVTGKQPWSEKNFDNQMAAIFYVGGEDVTPEYRNLTKLGLAEDDKLSDEMLEFLDMCL